MINVVSKSPAHYRIIEDEEPLLETAKYFFLNYVGVGTVTYLK